MRFGLWRFGTRRFVGAEAAPPSDQTIDVGTAATSEAARPVGLAVRPFRPHTQGEAQYARPAHPQMVRVGTARCREVVFAVRPLRRDNEDVMIGIAALST